MKTKTKELKPKKTKKKAPLKIKIPPGIRVKGFTNLKGWTSTRPKLFRCNQCQAVTSDTWDVMFGKGRYSFCSGECIEKYLTRAEEDRSILRIAEWLMDRHVSPNEIRFMKDGPRLKSETAGLEDAICSYYESYGVLPKDLDGFPEITINLPRLIEIRIALDKKKKV